MKKTRIGIIFGGRSGEHEVSLLSAKEVIAAINTSRYDIVPIGINKAGAWFQVSPEKLAATTGLSSSLALLPEPSDHPLISLEKNQLTAYLQSLDVVFPLIHGTQGEDGCLQGLLELANLPYIGSGVLGSALGMDKVLMKRVFQNLGLPITRFMSLNRHDWQNNPAAVKEKIESTLRYPLFIKPANLGSSVGISKAKNAQECIAALNLASKFDRKLIIEEAVPHAREIEVAILGNQQPEASIPGEIFPSREFYDYAAKYLDNASKVAIPASLSPELSAQLQAIALDAFKGLGCEGLARIDFLVNAQTLEPFISEINTLPGFTQISMYPKLWEHSGLKYDQLIDKLVELAFERHADIQKNLRHFSHAETASAFDPEKL